MALVRRTYRFTDDMARDLQEEAKRQGVDESHYVRVVLARSLGRADARDELTALREAVTDLTRATTSFHSDLRLLLQRLPRGR